MKVRVVRANNGFWVVYMAWGQALGFHPAADLHTAWVGALRQVMRQREGGA